LEDGGEVVSAHGGGRAHGNGSGFVSTLMHIERGRRKGDRVRGERRLCGVLEDLAVIEPTKL
jgi:hypothetical protein